MDEIEEVELDNGLLEEGMDKRIDLENFSGVREVNGLKDGDELTCYWIYYEFCIHLINVTSGLLQLGTSVQREPSIKVAPLAIKHSEAVFLSFLWFNHYMYVMNPLTMRL